MDPPVITRQRRPFLLPLWLLAIFYLGLAGAGVAAYRSATITTIVLTRHAEKQLGTIEDPPLTPQGELRAQELARMFGTVGGQGRIDAVYITATRRAQQTAAPLLARLREPAVVISDADSKDLASRILRENRGETVLVIGHGNTLPQLVRRLSGIDIAPVGEEEYDNLYIVSVPRLGNATVLQLKY